MIPCRPSTRNSATPPTTGGSTSGTVTSARSTARPRIARAGEHPGQRDAEHQREQRGERRRDQGQPQRLRRRRVRRAAVRATTTAPGPAGRPTGSTRKSDADGGGDQERRGDPRSRRGRRLTSALERSRRARKPASSSACWPSSERTRSTNACAASGFGAAASAQIGYSLIASSASGNSMPSTASPARCDVGGVDQRGVDLAELHLGERRADVLLQRVGHRGDAGRLEDLGRRPRRTAPRARRPRASGPAFAKSASPVIPAGLPAGTAISSTFSVKTSGSAACRSASVTTFICGWLAEANTSAGAPWVIWVASAELPAKLNWMSRSGLSAISWSPSSPKTSVSEAAAKTVSVPDRSPAGDRRRLPEAVSSADDPPQALSASSTADSASRARGPHRLSRSSIRICGELDQNATASAQVDRVRASPLPTGRRRSPGWP